MRLSDILRSQHFLNVWLPPHLLLIVGLLTMPITWSTIGWFLGFYCLISGLGVAVGYHRYFSHRAFQTGPVWEQLMLYFGALACQGPLLFWVALHRGLHHRYADTPKDPHSPIHGFWRSYQEYAFDTANLGVPLTAAKDLLRQDHLKWIEKHYLVTVRLTWLVVALVSLFSWSCAPILGLVMAQVWAIHQEALVNVFGHTKGFGAYRNFDTPDLSVNRPLLGLLTWGQALHNNHHARPHDADFGASNSGTWWELDPAMLWVRVISRRDVT